MAILISGGAPLGTYPLLQIVPLALVAFYVVVYLRLGRRPPRGSVVPRYEPPTALSAAATRYVQKSTADGRSVAAVLAQLAIRRCIRVEQVSGRYQISRLPANPEVEKQLAGEEARILEMLFEFTSPVTLNPSDGDDLKRYTLGIEGALLKRLGNSYATWHFGWIALGVLVSVFAGMVSAHFVPSPGGHPSVMLAWMYFWSPLLFAIVLAVVVIPVVKDLLRGIFGWRKIILALGLIAFVGYAAFGLTQKEMRRDVPPDLMAMLAALAVINVSAAPLLKTYTQKGRQALAEMEGFRLFLAKVEQDQYDRLNQPKTTPQPGGEYLPYAIALEIKVAWGDHLCDIFP